MPATEQPSFPSGSFSRRGALKAGAIAALVAGATSSVVSASPAAAAWGGYQNGRIPTSALAEIPWQRGMYLRSDATSALIALNTAFRQRMGHNLALNDAYRSYAKQQEARNYWCGRGNCGFAAVPGTSNHGWALAIDVAIGQRDWSDPAYVWLKNNAGTWGWLHPAWAEPNGKYPEAWHWEFGGTTAPPATPDLPLLEEDLVYPIRIDRVHCFLIAPGKIAHLNSDTPRDGRLGIASQIRNLTTANDSWIDLAGADFPEILRKFSIPNDKVVLNGPGYAAVLNVANGKFESGAYWSIDEENNQRIQQLQIKVDAVIASLEQGNTQPPVDSQPPADTQ